MKKYIYIKKNDNYKYLRVFGPKVGVIYEEYTGITGYSYIGYKIL